jgi:hypothetical protein
MTVLEVRGELQALLERRSPRDGQDGAGNEDGAADPEPDRAEARPVVLPPDAASSVGKSPPKTAAARSRKAG